MHVNAIGVKRRPYRLRKATRSRQFCRLCIDAIRAEGAIPLINHPNFRWAFTAKDMLPLRGGGMLEIASGHPYVNSDGDGTVPSHEQMWDPSADRGRTALFGAAVDDLAQSAPGIHALTAPTRAAAEVVARAAAFSLGSEADSGGRSTVVIFTRTTGAALTAMVKR